jgi:hypothetical protein
MLSLIMILTLICCRKIEKMNKKSTRRQIIFSGMAFLGAILTNNGCQRRSTSQVNQINQIPSSMPERILGNTGLSVPIFGLGGAGKTPLSRNNQEVEAIAMIECLVIRILFNIFRVILQNDDDFLITDERVLI